MPNRAYERSTRRERELVKTLRAAGYDACRSAGSHSPWDVWAWNKETNHVLLIQVKTTRGGKTLVSTQQQYGGVTVEERLCKWIKKKS